MNAEPSLIAAVREWQEARRAAHAVRPGDPSLATAFKRLALAEEALMALPIAVPAIALQVAA